MPIALPFNKTFSMVKGNTFDYDWQYLSGIPDDAGAVDLTGYSAKWVIHAPSGDLIYTTGATPGNSGVFFGGITNDPKNGIIDLVINVNDTLAFTWTTAPYDLTFTSPTGQVFTLLRGIMQIVLTVTP